MALNPHLYGNGMPVAFVNEMFVLIRDGIEFEINNIHGANGGTVKAKGRVFLSNVRIVLVADKPTQIFTAFDMPLLYVHDEKFHQPVFHCNNISGCVEPVLPYDQNRAMYPSHSFKILFKHGGCGTFVPLFFNLIKLVRQYNQQFDSGNATHVDPLRAAHTPVDEMMNCAYVDPSDPTKIYLQQPASEAHPRNTYHS
ncbi:putative WW domain-binding protein [Helianthus debilis subsp. tardiflorus]